MRIGIFAATIQAFLFFGHYFVYLAFVKFFSITDPKLLFLTRLGFVALSVSFLLATLITYRYFGPALRVAYAGAAVWMGTLYWLFLASVLAWVVYGAGRLVGQERLAILMGAVFLVAAFAVSFYGVWNSYQTKVRHISITLAHLPKEWRGRKLVMVADTHLGNMRNMGFAKKIASLVQSQNPDIVLIPGDFFDGPPADYEKLSKPFAEIKSAFGTYFAAGNHEEFNDRKPILEAMRRAGIKVLDSEAVNLEGLQIVGIGYVDSLNAENQKSIIRRLKLDPSLPSILIKHVPSNINAAEETGIDLQVSGHTHLGQVYPFWYLTRKIYGQFYYGHKTQGKTQVITTSGAGTWGPPQRVGTNSEIWVVELN